MSRFTDQTTQSAIKRKTNDGPARNPVYEGFRRFVLEVLAEIGVGPGPGGGVTTITAAQISDATASGRTVITSSAGDARLALGLGTAAVLSVGASGGVAAYDDPRFAAGGGGGGAPSTVTASQISDGSPFGRGIIVGTAAQALAALNLAPGTFGGVTSVIRGGYNPENQQGFTDQKSTSYEALSVDVGNYGPAKFGIDGGATFGLPHAVCGKMIIPANSTMYAHAIGVGGWIKNYNPGSKTFAVALYGDARAMATGACTWGINSVSADMGFETPLLYGYECDVANFHPNTTVLGIDIIGGSTVAPNGNSSALHIQAIGYGAAADLIPWPRAISIRGQSCLTAMEVGPRRNSANMGSPPIILQANNGSNVPYPAGRIQVADSGDFLISSPAPGKVLKLQTTAGNGSVADAVTCLGSFVAIGPGILPAYTLDVGGAAFFRSGMGINGNAPVGRQVVTGRISDGSALASLMQALSLYGFVDTAQVTF